MAHTLGPAPAPLLAWLRGMTAERVAVDVVDCWELIRWYRRAAGELASTVAELRPLVAEAVELLAQPPIGAVVHLEGLAVELADDGDDLAWRVDFIVDTDARLAADRRRIGLLPSRRGGRPQVSAVDLARRLDELVERGSVLGGREWRHLLEGLRAFVRADPGDPEWNDVVAFWGDELVERDPELAGELAEVFAALERLDGLQLADVASLVDHLVGQQHDPRYLAEVFGALGARRTLDLVELVSTLAYAEALAAPAEVPEYSFDPIELRDRLSDAFGIASRSVVSARHHGLVPTLSSVWFDELFEAGVVVEDRWFAADRMYVHDALPALFASGHFRDDVARRAGELGLEIFDHRVEVRRGPGSPLYEGFGVLETRWEDRAGLLTGAAARDPQVAAGLLVHETSSGRTGAEIVADRSFDNMDPHVAAGHYADLVLAGTVTAEEMALENGVDARAVAALHDPWHAKAALITAIAGQTRLETQEPPHPPELNTAFSAMVVQTMPHFMAVPPRGHDGVSIDLGLDATVVPSDEAGIAVRPEVMKFLLGALFRHEDDRTALVVSVAKEQKLAFVLDPSLTTLERAGLLEGAVVNGFNVSGIDDAQQVAREIEDANSFVDHVWEGSRFIAGLLPGGSVVTTSVKAAARGARAVDIAAGLGGVDPLERFVHGDSGPVLARARTGAESNVFDADLRPRQFVFGRALEQMQAEYRLGGAAALGDTSRAIFGYVSSEADLSRVFVPGETTIADLRDHGGEVWSEYDSAAWQLTRIDSALREQVKIFRVGIDDAHIELSTR